MRKLRVLALMLKDFLPPETIEGLSFKEMAPFKTEYDVMAALEALGHDARALGVTDDLSEIRDALNEFKPHLAFNLLEEFSGVSIYHQYVVSFLELVRQRYTGCNPRGLMLSHDKALSKKILAYHRVHVPGFAVFPLGRVVRRPKRLAFPLLVKSTSEEGSVGISQASVVYNDEKLKDRVAFVHEQLRTDAIAEEFIEGRELYVGVLGNKRLQTLPIWELHIKKLPEGAPHIATEKIKWDLGYQERSGVMTTAANDLGDELSQRIHRLCKKVYRILQLTGYARIDLRLKPDGRVFVLEANPNPQLAYGEDFAESAHAAGLDYERLIQRILTLGLGYRAEWQIWQ